MAYELGGRAGKSGDNYERNYVISLLLEIVQEKINGIKFEPLGDEESGTDVVIYNKNGSKLFAQCKGRNGSTEYWTAASLRDIFAKMVRHLERDDTNEVALVTPLNCTMLEDLIKRAKTNDRNPNDFYNFQILTSLEMEKFYKTLCEGYELRGISDNELDIIKSISYLSRTQFWQMPDTYMKEIIKQKIEMIFVGNSETIINQLQDYVITDYIFGNKITICELDNFFKTRGIEYRNLLKNPAIFPKIQELNKLFLENNSLINNTLIEREEMLKCFEHLLNDQSIVIHGRAGVGKTGCVKGIIEQCKHKRIPYLAVSLDSYTEAYNSEQLGELLGLPASPVFCLNSISREKAVLLLDQLDALRWTQSHSQTAINTCKQLIEEVESLNKDREQKIIIAFVCRTYDLKNDTQIQSLFNKENAVFQEVEIPELASNTLEELVGEEYQNLSNKQRE
ncbi:MAG: AAA family ATPase, partial [Culicoidibacterales bacterium]